MITRTRLCNLSLFVTKAFLGCRHIGETLSTVRFGQRVKSVRNKPVINEISEDDVNDLSDQIRQLKVKKNLLLMSFLIFLLVVAESIFYKIMNLLYSGGAYKGKILCK